MARLALVLLARRAVLAVPDSRWRSRRWCSLGRCCPLPGTSPIAMSLPRGRERRSFEQLAAGFLAGLDRSPPEQYAIWRAAACWAVEFGTSIHFRRGVAELRSPTPRRPLLEPDLCLAQGAVRSLLGIGGGSLLLRPEATRRESIVLDAATSGDSARNPRASCGRSCLSCCSWRAAGDALHGPHRSGAGGAGPPSPASCWWIRRSPENGGVFASALQHLLLRRLRRWPSGWHRW